MTFKKGDIKPANSGKKKGTENKATRDIKEAFRMLIEKNLDNMTDWLEKVAAKNPTQALMIISDLAEYTIPKLARTQHEHSGQIDTTPTSFKVIIEDERSSDKNAPETR